MKKIYKKSKTKRLKIKETPAVYTAINPMSKIYKTTDENFTFKSYYEKPGFQLFHANCLNVLAEIEENSIDMIFADPPYFLSSGTFTCQNGRMVSVKKGDWDLSNGLRKNFNFHLEWIKACKRVLKPHGTIWISGTYHSIYQCGFALQLAGFHIFNYDLMKNKDWSEDQMKKKGMQMRSVWSINTPKGIEKKFGKHPTQKSFDLLKRIVLASTNKGDVILDPFTGSSTTGLAAYLYGRNFIGIDTEKQYLDLSIKRLEELGKNIKDKLNKEQL